MKQTAVQWLFERLDISQGYESAIELLEKAKAMEKEQIIEAWNTGTYAYNNGEQYYTETYESNN